MTAPSAFASIRRNTSWWAARATPTRGWCGSRPAPADPPHAVDHPGRDTALTPAQRAAAETHAHQQASTVAVLTGAGFGTPLSWQTEIAHRLPYGYTQYADLILHAPDADVPAMLLEIDRVTEPVDDLVAKVRRYTEWFELLAPKADPDDSFPGVQADRGRHKEDAHRFRTADVPVSARCHAAGRTFEPSGRDRGEPSGSSCWDTPPNPAVTSATVANSRARWTPSRPNTGRRLPCASSCRNYSGLELSTVIPSYPIPGTRWFSRR
ncbi:hypothetical protein GCM10010387_62250 [Streptomyces inusitatus]|uniref:Uncharacterized protein n=1 Tax=Streptomyces inusitatus TaxID=68221 RepID=A0A918QM44_9ACTN|nr:hypothetical protein GCM10010387_62250 [Streptomyces inusitatus]